MSGAGAAGPPALLRRAGVALLCLGPGALLLGLALEAGGYFAGAAGYATGAIAVVLAVRLVAAHDPLAGARPLTIVAAAALGGLAAWTLASGSWSHAPGRAVLDYDRVLGYALLVALYGTARLSPRALRAMAGVLVLAGAAVCVIALVSLVPSGPFHPPAHTAAAPAQRLSYPLTYWNALGLIAALAVLGAARMAVDDREPGWVRAAGVAVVPPAVATIVLSGSRGAVLGAVVGAVALLVLGRPRAALTGAPVVAAAAAVAAVAAHRLQMAEVAGALRAPHGGGFAAVLALTATAGAAVRLALSPLDRRAARLRIGRGAALAGVAGLLAVAVAGLAVADAPGRVDRAWRQFRTENTVGNDVQARIGTAGNNGRLALWRVARGMHADAPVRGTGAGTFTLYWQARRPTAFEAYDGHSLAIETLGELGDVGLVLAAAGLLALLAAAIRPPGGPAGLVPVGAAAALAAWLVTAQLDWHWEMPAVTGPVLAMAAAAAASGGRAPAAAARSRPAARVATALAAVLVVGLAIGPVRVAEGQGHLDTAVAAASRGDCRRAIPAAAAAARITPARAEPWTLLAQCSAVTGDLGGALRDADAAVARDPRSSWARYTRALVRARAGRPYRRDLAAARRWNPLDSVIIRTAEAADRRSTVARRPFVLP